MIFNEISHPMSMIRTIPLLFILILGTAFQVKAQDSTNVVYVDTIVISVIDELDVFGTLYKLTEEDQVFMVRNDSVLNRIDTTIYLDSRAINPDDSICLPLIDYFQDYIKVPGHSGEVFITLSFMVDEDGLLQDVHVLNDVQNPCCEDEWQIEVRENHYFYNSTGRFVEYIIDVEDIQFCVPIIEKDNGRPARTIRKE